MKILLLALALALPAENRSLGIGIDVLPEAFGFAARRVGFMPDLRLSSCTASSCLWDLGHGVRMTADHPSDSLNVTRIEARRETDSKSDAKLDARGFAQACVAIVALVAPEAGQMVQRATAAALVQGIEPPVDLAPERGISFYGTETRCGATTSH